MQGADRVVVVRMDYRQFGRAASMTFYGQRLAPGPPTLSDLENIANVMGLWENSGFGVGYALLRSFDSRYTNTHTWSLDRRLEVSYQSGPFDRPGLILGAVSALLPTACAPLVYWDTGPYGRRPRGRTYCVGLTENTDRFTGDTSYINDLYGDALVTQMNEIRGFLGDVGYRQVILRKRAGGVDLPQANVFPVVDATIGDRKMGTQRRRTRPAS